jgi:quercetin dioxygenase-like cupin family protein
MLRSPTFTIAIAIATVLPLTIGVATAQQGPPEGNVGFSTSKTEVVELGPEIEGMDGRQLRLRILNIEPGGHIGVHSHENLPAVQYVVKGATTIYSADGGKKVVSAGETASSNKDTTHWLINEGNEPAVFIAVDIFEPKK